MSWTPGNALVLRNLINNTDFMLHFRSIEPELGGQNNEDRLTNANKCEMWQKVIKNLNAMANAEPEPEQESPNINAEGLNTF